MPEEISPELAIHETLPGKWDGPTKLPRLHRNHHHLTA